MNVLFDLDGTLTDPGDGFVACVSYALAKLGCRPRTDEQIRRHVGPPLQESLVHLLDGDRAKVPAALALYRERYGAGGLLECRVYPEIEATLEALRSAGARLFVATSKPTVYAERILAHFRLGPFFSGIYGSELDGTRAHKVELLSHLIERESLAEEVGSTCMVGDRAQDVVAALAHGLRPVGALWGYGTRDELAAAGAAALCERPADLPRAARVPCRKAP